MVRISLYRYIKSALISVLLAVICFSSAALKAQSDDVSDFFKAQELYRDGEIGEAAILFSKLKRSPRLMLEQRNIAAEQLDACFHLLRTNPAQTDVFGSLISLQKDNQIMRFLLYQYASLLESQGRHDELIAVHKKLYHMAPTDSQKYTLARKLDAAGHHQEAYDLYNDLLDSRNYRDTVLRHMLETVHELDNASAYFDAFFEAKKEIILNNYGLFNLLITTLIKLERYNDALVYAYIMANDYPNLLDMIAYKLSSPYKDGRLTDGQINAVLTRSKSPMPQQRYLLSKVYGAAGETDRAIEILGSGTHKQIVEYRAQLYHQTGKHDFARKMYLKLIEDYTPQPQWYQKLAQIAFETGNDDQAVAALRSYISLSENKDFNTYFYVARLLERYGLSEEAKQMYLEGKKIARNHKYATIELIKYYINQKEFDSAAAEIFETQKRAAVKPMQLYFSLKNSFTEQSMVTAVINELEKLVEHPVNELNSEQKSNVYYTLYVFASNIGDFSRSIRFFKPFYKLAPDNYNELISFSIELEQVGLYQESLDLLNLIDNDSPMYYQAVHKKVELFIKQGNPRQALAILQEHPEVRSDYLYASALLEAGNKSAARDVLQKMSYKTPKATLLEARIAMLDKQFDHALKLYATIDESAGGEYIGALYSTALAHLFAQSFDEALIQFERLGRFYAHAPEASDAIQLRKLMALITATKNDRLIDFWVDAEFYRWADDTEAAITSFNNVLSLDEKAPYAPDIHLRLSKMYVRAQQYEKALAQLDAVIEHASPASAIGPWAMSMRITLRKQIAQEVVDKQVYLDLLEKYPDSYDADVIRKQLENERTDHELSPHM